MAGPALAQRASRPAPAAEPVLTLEAISRDTGKWAGTPPVGVRWTEDGAKLHFLWNPERGDRNEWYELDVKQPGGMPRKIDDAERRWLSSNPGRRNKAKTLKVYAFSGDLYLHDVRSGKTQQITRTSGGESNPRFSFDESSIHYQQGMNLYEWVIETGETRQITDIRRGRDPEDRPRLSKQDEYLEKQQLDMF
ncbi:MAG TPA: DPP IV N-terminal domain-containing protein, partial [Candidatus Acidoferrales bacterium]